MIGRWWCRLANVLAAVLAALPVSVAALSFTLSLPVERRAVLALDGASIVEASVLEDLLKGLSP